MTAPKTAPAIAPHSVSRRCVSWGCFPGGGELEGGSGLGVDSDDISELVLTLVETAWGVDAIDGLGNRVLDTLLRLLVDSSPV